MVHYERQHGALGPREEQMSTQKTALAQVEWLPGCCSQGSCCILDVCLLLGGHRKWHSEVLSWSNVCTHIPSYVFNIPHSAGQVVWSTHRQRK